MSTTHQITEISDALVKKTWGWLFNNYLCAPWPKFGHFQGNHLPYPRIIIFVVLVRRSRHLPPRLVTNRTQMLRGVWVGTLSMFYPSELSIIKIANKTACSNSTRTKNYQFISKVSQVDLTELYNETNTSEILVKTKSAFLF